MKARTALKILKGYAAVAAVCIILLGAAAGVGAAAVLACVFLVGFAFVAKAVHWTTIPLAEKREAMRADAKRNMTMWDDEDDARRRRDSAPGGINDPFRSDWPRHD